MKKQLIVVGVAFGICLIIALWPVSERQDLSVISGADLQRQSNWSFDGLTPAQRHAAYTIKANNDCLNIYGEREETNISILDGRGDLKGDVLIKMGVKPENLEAISDAVERARRQMESSFSSRIQVDNFRSNETEAVRAFTVVSDRGTGDEILNDLRRSFETICGVDEGDTLFRAIRPANQFGCFGRQELRIQIHDSGDGNGNGWEVKVQSIEPQTRAKLKSISIRTPEDLRFFFGEAFKIASMNQGQ